MINDVIILKEEHREKALKVANRFYDGYDIDVRINMPFIICIGGGPGTGKTEIACFLEDDLRFDFPTSTMSLDDYYTLTPQERVINRQLTQSAGAHEINWHKVYRDIKLLSKHHEIIIIEGLYALNLDICDYGIHVTGNMEKTEAFRKERAKEPVECEFRQQVVMWEEIATCRLVDNADYVI